nr:MAG TPA: hypothetical protein [Caudoviricetes sp.]
MFYVYLLCIRLVMRESQKLYNTTYSVYNKKYIIFKGSCLCNL